MRSLKSIHIVGAIFTLILGTLLHFVWEWSGRSDLTAVFSAVNESTWEHLKLLYFPFVVFSVIEYFMYGKHKNCFLNVKVRSVVLGMFAIVAAFYTYTGVIGKNYFPLDLGTFILGVFLTYRYSYQNMENDTNNCSVYSEAFALFVMIALAVAFGIFTFSPPELGLFLPPNP